MPSRQPASSPPEKHHLQHRAIGRRSGSGRQAPGPETGEPGRVQDHGRRVRGRRSRDQRRADRLLEAVRRRSAAAFSRRAAAPRPAHRPARCCRPARAPDRRRSARRRRRPAPSAATSSRLGAASPGQYSPARSSGAGSRQGVTLAHPGPLPAGGEGSELAGRPGVRGVASDRRATRRRSAGN